MNILIGLGYELVWDITLKLQHIKLYELCVFKM
jgi:hypothetical protein